MGSMGRIRTLGPIAMRRIVEEEKLRGKEKGKNGRMIDQFIDRDKSVRREE